MARRLRASAGSETKPPVLPCETVKVHPRIWTAAMRLAHGDSTRITVLGPEDVIVHNHSRKAPRRKK